jgi:hypothetical protein
VSRKHIRLYRVETGCRHCHLDRDDSGGTERSTDGFCSAMKASSRRIENNVEG